MTLSTLELFALFWASAFFALYIFFLPSIWAFASSLSCTMVPDVFDSSLHPGVVVAKPNRAASVSQPNR